LLQPFTLKTDLDLVALFGSQDLLGNHGEHDSQERGRCVEKNCQGATDADVAVLQVKVVLGHFNDK
jgi:hypothetical protein